MLLKTKEFMVEEFRSDSFPAVLPSIHCKAMFNRMRHRPLILAAMVAAVSCAAFGGDKRPTTVTGITIMKDDGEGSPGAAVESIQSADRLFHVVIRLDVGVEKKIFTELIAIKTADDKNISVLTKTFTLHGVENTITLDYSLPNDWPPGKYTVHVSTGGRLLKTKVFMVE
jgi:hypothetical protein